MSTVTAPSPWPAPNAPAWRFAREIGAPRCDAVQWRMPRFRVGSAVQLMVVFVALSGVSLAIGAGFWWLGAPGVLPFAGIELLALCAAMWACARHADDAETLTLSDHRLLVEHRSGRNLQQAAFRAEWVRVEPCHGEGSLIEISGQGRSMRVGRYLRPELRGLLAREIRSALRRASAPPAAPATTLETQR